MDCSLLPQHILLWQSGQFDRYHITAWGEGGGGGVDDMEFPRVGIKGISMLHVEFPGLN